jgi:pimeloyl-ACP methyl ester carboxylesterase
VPGVPEEVSSLTADNVVDVLIGGFGCSQRGYEALRAEMERVSGGPVVFVGSDRWGRELLQHDQAYPSALYRQALHVVATLRAKGITKARLFGHSMGGTVALIVADAFPEMVDSVVLLCSAGIYVDSTLRLGWRLLDKVFGDWHDAWRHPDKEVRAVIYTCLMGAWSYAFNVVRSTAEGMALSQYRAFELLHHRLSARGIIVYVAYATDDTMFLTAEVLAAIQSLEPEHIVELTGLPHDVQYHPRRTVAILQAHGLL